MATISTAEVTSSSYRPGQRLSRDKIHPPMRWKGLLTGNVGGAVASFSNGIGRDWNLT